MRKEFVKHSALLTFNSLLMSLSASEEKVVKVVTFEDLEAPLFVSNLTIAGATSGVPVDFRLIHLNSEGQSIELLSVFGHRNLTLPTFFDLGLFMIGREDKIIIEYKGATNFWFEFFLGMNSKRPVYRTYKFYELDKPLRLRPFDFDGLYIANFGRGVFNQIKINGKSLSVNHSFEITNPHYVTNVKNLFDIGTRIEGDLVITDDYSVPSFILVMKEKYNKEIFQVYQHQLEALRDDIVYNFRADYENSVFKMLFGGYSNLDKLNEMILQSAQASFNRKNEGYYDSYELPSDDVSSSGSSMEGSGASSVQGQGQYGQGQFGAASI